MTSQTINNHAKARYAEFEFALDAARTAFDELAKMTKAVTGRSGRKTDRFEGWQVPSLAEVNGALRKASVDLDELRTAATKRKAELISRNWRI